MTSTHLKDCADKYARSKTTQSTRERANFEHTIIILLQVFSVTFMNLMLEIVK